jgi:serine/threonine-protein kinase HipA
MKSEKVYFNNILAGVIEELSTGEVQFTYDAGYLGDEKNPAISNSLPKQTEPFKEQGLPPFFDGLIPEGWLLTLAADKYKLNPIRDRFALLLATCQDTIGAVTIGEPIERKEKEPKKWDHEHLEKLAEELGSKYQKCLYCYKPIDNKKERIYHRKCSLELFNTESAPVLDFDVSKLKELGEQNVNEKLAVPGVQKKVSLSLDVEPGTKSQKAYRMTVANLWARYILKPKSHPPHLPENEHLTQMMARQANIKTANCGLIPLANGDLAFISERFDRPRDGGKLHVEDFCQILEKRPEQKYIGSIEQVAKSLRIITSKNAPEDNVLRLFEMAIFSFIVGNSDLHLKNISVLQTPHPTLSPAYDLLCTDIWIKDDDQTALSLGGKKNKLIAQDFLNLAEHLGIKEKVAQNVYVQMKKSIPGWFNLIDTSFLENEFKTKYKSIIETRFAILTGTKF